MTLLLFFDFILVFQNYFLLINGHQPIMNLLSFICWSDSKVLQSLKIIWTSKLLSINVYQFYVISGGLIYADH